MEGTERLLFVLGDVLPTIYDVAISIFNIACKPQSLKMQQCINAVKAVKDRVQAIVLHYYNNVYVEQNRTKPKKKNMVLVKKSMRQLNREWSTKTLAITKKKLVKIDSLFNVGIDMEKLEGDEKLFYENQIGARLSGFRLSQEIDMDYVAKKEAEEEER